ncbi:MAG: TlpA family protein disulfide reductase, partial [Pirellulales bacterium]|nr:TlpA family protein disulfide reductase [Pirellulales bacterium]
MNRNASHVLPITGRLRLCLTLWALATLPLAGCSCTGEKPASAGDARKVMSKTLESYRNADAYSDRGALVLFEAREDGEDLERPPIPFAVSLRRPNQLQLIAGLPPNHDAAIVGESIVVSDGERARVTTSVQEEVREIPSPEAVEKSLVEKAVADSLIGRCKLPTVRLDMLMGSESLDAIIPGLEQAEILEPEELDSRLCLRVSVPTADGPVVYWIDQEQHTIRRIEFPVETAKRAFAWHDRLKIAQARFDFLDAKFEADEDIKRYQMEVGDNAVVVSEWLPRAPLPLAANLGQQAEEFSFSDLDGNDVTSESLADKVVVIDFWATWCKPCLVALPKLSELRDKYKDNPRVVFMAVSTDEPDVSNARLQEVFANNKIDLPIYRDAASYYRLVFDVGTLPTTIVLDGSRIVQMSEAGATETQIAAAIDDVLAGVDVAQRKKLEFREAVAAREKFLSEVLVGAAVGESSNRIADQSKPTRLKLTKLWTCDALAQPRHILTTDSASGTPRVYVHDGWSSIVEIGLDGKVIDTHEFKLPGDSPVSTSRTVVDGNGVRHFVAFATKQNQVHVFDNLWKHRFSYPDADLTHPGISNVLLADLNGDAVPEINISFWGAAGVQALSLEGKRLWPRRLIKSLEDIQGL